MASLRRTPLEDRQADMGERPPLNMTMLLGGEIHQPAWVAAAIRPEPYTIDTNSVGIIREHRYVGVNRGEAIVLFGEGEERRDHVDVDDIAEIVRLVLAHRSAGVLNIATGTVASFRAVADKAVALSPRKVEIKCSPRNGPMPHNGYRPFDPAATRKAFPGFRYTAIDAGLARAQRQEFG